MATKTVEITQKNPHKGISTSVTSKSQEANHSEYLIDYREAAKRLKLCRRSVELLVKRGKIPHIKIGRSVRFDWNSVLNALNHQTTA